MFLYTFFLLVAHRGVCHGSIDWFAWPNELLFNDDAIVDCCGCSTMVLVLPSEPVVVTNCGSWIWTGRVVLSLVGTYRYCQNEANLDTACVLDYWNLALTWIVTPGKQMVWLSPGCICCCNCCCCCCSCCNKLLQLSSTFSDLTTFFFVVVVGVPPLAACAALNSSFSRFVRCDLACFRRWSLR